MRILSIILFLFFFQASFGQELAVSAIPEELTKDVDAVVRYDNTFFEIASRELVKTQRSWAVTVFNEKGADRHATFQVSYSRLSDINDIECSLYDAEGNRLKNLKKKDIQDIGMGFQSDWVTDLRVKIAGFDDKNYAFPYTVVFSYEESSKNPMFYPTWEPLSGERMSVQESKLEVLTNSSIPYRFKEVNYNSKGTKGVLISSEFKKWKVTNIKAAEYESYSQNNDRCEVILAPMEFELDGQKGMMQSWASVAKFYSDFNADSRDLPLSTINKLKSLIAPSDSWETKVKKVYEYMQSHTRYMSIQLGVGGWKSMPAELVAEKGYGDCKALTNYMVAMLNQIGIEAYPALINAGDNARLDHLDFPRMTFNHVIACVPSAKDTLWLECTSQDNPFGYLGDFTGNRESLIVKPRGGEIARTINYHSAANFQHRRAKVKLNEDGSAEMLIETNYGGLQQDSKAYRYKTFNENDRKDWLVHSIDIPNFELKSSQFQLKSNSIPELNEKLEVFSKKLASVSGKRVFLKLNLMTTFFSTPEKVEERRTELFLNPNTFAFEDSDTTIFDLPADIKIEYLPKPTVLESEFGNYYNSVERVGNQLVYVRKVTMNGGIYATNTYNSFQEFVRNVNRADAAKVVMVLGET